jgi:uncharacterized membrane protein YccC
VFKRWIIYIYCFIPLWSWSQSASSPPDELKGIDQQIQNLKNQLHEQEAIERQEEIKGQGLMIADWEAYSKEIERIRRQQDIESHIQQQIDQLEQLKTGLLKPNTHSMR